MIFTGNAERQLGTGVDRAGDDTRVGEHAEALRGVERDLLEFVAHHTTHAVELGERLVHERVLGAEALREGGQVR